MNLSFISGGIYYRWISLSFVLFFFSWRLNTVIRIIIIIFIIILFFKIWIAIISKSKKEKKKIWLFLGGTLCNGKWKSSHAPRQPKQTTWIYFHWFLNINFFHFFIYFYIIKLCIMCHGISQVFPFGLFFIYH